MLQNPTTRCASFAMVSATGASTHIIAMLAKRAWAQKLHQTDGTGHGRKHPHHSRLCKKGVGAETTRTRWSLLRAQAPLQSSSSWSGRGPKNCADPMELAMGTSTQIIAVLAKRAWAQKLHQPDEVC
jgi:hypothetical protein